MTAGEFIQKFVHAFGVGQRHTVYDRFNRGNARGLWEQVLMTPHKGDGLAVNGVIIDSTTMKVRRHGVGQKGGGRPKGCPGRG